MAHKKKNLWRKVIKIRRQKGASVLELDRLFGCQLFFFPLKSAHYIPDKIEGASVLELDKLFGCHDMTFFSL